MASETIRGNERFPVGTSVSVYPAQNRHDGQAPVGSAVTSATVASDSTLTFTGLTDGAFYVAYALVNGEHRYVGFAASAPPSSAESGSVVAAPTGNAATDTGNIQAALDAANAAGGGLVNLRPGVYRINQVLTLYRSVQLRGCGVGVTVIKLADGATSGGIITAGYATWSVFGAGGGSNTVGPFDFSIDGLSLDGNKANAAGGGVGLTIYGFNYKLNGVHVHDWASDGVRSEWAAGDSSSYEYPAGGPEAHWRDVKVYRNNGRGVDWRGPHDSTWNGVHIFLNGTVAAPTIGMYVAQGNAAYSGTAVQMTNCHVWSGLGTPGASNMTYALQVDDGSIQATNCAFEGASIADVWVRANEWMLAACKFFNSPKGLIVGDSGGGHSAGGGKLVGARFTNITNAAVDCTNSGGNCTLEGSVFGAVTTVIAANPTDLIALAGAGGALSVLQTPAGSAWPAPVDPGGAPSQHGLLGWSLDPACVTNQGALTAGAVYYSRVNVPNGGTIGHVGFYVGAVAVTPTAGQCWVGVFAFTGGNTLTLIGLSTAADALTAFTTAGEISVKKGNAVAVTPAGGQSLVVAPNTPVWVGLLFNGTTGPNLVGVTGDKLSGAANYNLDNFGPYRQVFIGSGLTALPTAQSIAAGNSPQGSLRFAAVAA